MDDEAVWAGAHTAVINKNKNKYRMLQGLAGIQFLVMDQPARQLCGYRKQAGKDGGCVMWFASRDCTLAVPLPFQASLLELVSNQSDIVFEETSKLGSGEEGNLEMR